MFKLLSPEQNKIVEGEYKRRRFIVFLLGLNFVLVLGVIGLFPTYALVTTRLTAVNDLISNLNHNMGTSTDADLKAWADETNKTLALLTPVNDTDAPYEFFQEIINSKSSGVHLSALSWHKDAKKVSLILTGVAKDRQALLDFESKLNSSSKFAPTNFPVSDLAQDKDINFQVTLNPAL
ncbi:hypothetical protein KW790_01580 [Candidatus Parcubacteria bacterium]|nr:hypothetical protein [Candidatus Parcubacteria bacterium]